jgi:3-oxoacyl-[acyl-carrier protein] reductase
VTRATETVSERAKRPAPATNGRAGARTREGCALVTGASRGIGAAIARALAADGWPVGINYRSDVDGAEAVAAGIRDAGGDALAIRADVSRPEAAEALLPRLADAFGPALVVVNNAGLTADGLSLRLGDDDWDRVLETNLTGAFRITRRALGDMVRARFGRIVNVASVVGQRANPGQANYAASKAGLVALTKTVAVEVARRGVTVNAVAPGFIATELTAGLPEDGGLLAAIPARRTGTPEEVAACVRFLASEEAAYVTGAILTVDGGMTA